MSKKRLLWISDNPYVETGMGRVTRETLRVLKSKYDVAVAGWNCEHSDNYKGMMIDRPDGQFKVYSIRKDCKEEKDDVFKAINTFKPNYIFFFGDQWNFWYSSEIYKNYPQIITGCYINVDSGPVSNNHAELFKFYDTIIASSEFSKSELRKVIPTRDIKVSYHGIDFDKYYPIKTDIAKNKLGINKNIFSIGYVARNQRRKNIPSMLKIYSEFCKNKDDVLFTFISDINNPNNTNVNIISMVNRLIPRNKINIIETRPSKSLTDEHMNLVYNSFDLYTSTSYAEGQGMPIMEAMATGSIPVVPDAYCMKEIAREGVLVPISGYVTLEAERNFACVDENKFIQVLNQLYDIYKQNKPHFNELVQRNITTSTKFRWENLAKTIYNSLEQATIEGKDTCITTSIYG